MIFAELPLAEAEGAMLAHSVALKGRRHPKGALVDAALLADARAEGLARLWVARMEPGDVAEADAAVAIAARLAGDGVEAGAPVHGRVNLHATRGGLLQVAPEHIMAANGGEGAVGVSVLPPMSPVAAGDLVGTVKLIPYALGADELARVTDALAPIEVRAWRPGLTAILIQTRLAETPDKLLAKTSDVTVARLDRLGVHLVSRGEAPHAVQPLAAAMQAPLQPDLLLVAGATATSDRRDVIPAAIEAAGGEVLRVGMPVDPGNLLVLGRIGATLVIGLPGCARSPKRNGLDLVLELWAAGFELSSARIAAMGVGGLLDGGGRPVPWGWSG